MIVVDSSALIEIILDQPMAAACAEVLEREDEFLISAGTMAECLIVAIGHAAEQPLNDIFDRFGIQVVPLTEAGARAAARAYRRYGKKWHAAALNYGDCFAYALADERRCPLLFVGNDFALTDVVPAIAKAEPPRQG